MFGRQLLRSGCPALALFLAVAVVASGCARKRPPATDDRDRDPFPPVTETDPGDNPGGMTEDETARVERERAMATVGEMVFFDFNRSELNDEARETLRQKADVLRDYPDIRVRIEGHCDERGTVEYNLALGERRAEASRQYLVDLGIDPDRLTTVSYGEERALVEGQNESAWAQNRRDEFVPLGI